MNVIGPGSTIGILGGGQLGRMLAVEARRMGYVTCAVDPTEECPARKVVDRCYTASWEDEQTALQLAREADVVTVETELIPYDLLARLELVTNVRPGSTVLYTIQDRLRQKTFLERGGFPQAAFAEVSCPSSLREAASRAGLPAVLKSRRAGYDGKGQAKVESAEDLAPAWSSIGEAPAILEKFIDFRTEVSVVLARSIRGELSCYPLVENVHRRHILHTSRCPASVEPAVEKEAVRIASGIAEALGHVGTMAVEMFLLADDRLLVNEIAPRTHNSGHFTFGACLTSQFEQHLRAITGLPLGDPTLLTPAVMLNLLGDLYADGQPRWESLLAHPRAKLHLYGKAVAAPGRKMGHVVLLGDAGEHSLELADEILEDLSFSK